jgi:hypothetical protein
MTSGTAVFLIPASLDSPKLILDAAPKYHRGDAVAHLLGSSDRARIEPGSSQLTSSDRNITK